MSAAAVAAPEQPRRPALDRATAMRLARIEYERFVDAVRRLRPADWHEPTANTAWDVHAMVCHVTGMAEMAASPLESRRQVRAAQRAEGLFIDALTDLQVHKHVHRSPAELTDALAKATARAAKGRARTPGFLRSRPLPQPQPVDGAGPPFETWTLGYLVDVILTRDPWMHRSDLALASGQDMVLTADHDGVLVADVVAEWAQRHGQPVSLTLTGPAGGTWQLGGGGPHCELDAVEFCRILSGRGSGDGLLLRTRVPF